MSKELQTVIEKAVKTGYANKMDVCTIMAM